MEGPYRVLYRCAMVWVFFSLCFAGTAVQASHEEHESLQSPEATAIGRKHRTGYHFQPRKNWMNDPNGPMYYKGYYHLFYQYNPKEAVWGNIRWAHSVSKDLINWTPLPVAIFPTASFDATGCWSGSATILPDGRPAILYTGNDTVGRQVQNLAFPSNLSDPLLVRWSKPPYNPLIVPPPDINVTSFRDPTTAWLGPDGQWRVVIGSTRHNRSLALLYRSRDFRTWVRARHPLHAVAKTGMWECPDFYPVALSGEYGVDVTYGGYSSEYKHVLKASLDKTRYEYYTIGTYDVSRDKYVPNAYLKDDLTGLRYDYGNFYASKTFFDESTRRRILWGWANESDTNKSRKGWAGIQAIPRKIWLDEGGRQLVQWPVEELEQLRFGELKLKDVLLRSGGGLYHVKGFQTSEADVEVTFRVKELEKAEPFDPSWTADPERLCGLKGTEVKGGVGPFGLLVLATADRMEQTAVFFRVFKGHDKHVVLTCHDPSRSTKLNNVAYKPSFGGFVDVDIARDGKISLRVLIDNSVVESFAAGGRTCITSRVYPLLAEGRSANLFAFNNGESDVEITELRAWRMKRPLSMN